MEFVDAFLLATGWAYLGCLVFTIWGRPPLADIRELYQGLFYAFASIIFMTIDVYPHYVHTFLGAVYSFAAVGSFIGYPQVWMAYWTSVPVKGSAAGQIGMAFWDLMIAVFCFMKAALF